MKNIVTLDSSSMAEMRSERRSKQRRGSGDLCAAEATIDSNCATNTPNLESGTSSLTNFFAIVVKLKEQTFWGFRKYTDFAVSSLVGVKY